MVKKNLGVFRLVSLVVGAMIGSGIFTIPKNVANEAGVGGSLIAWFITGIGMLSLTFVFMDLSIKRPDLDAGIYSYAREGFGNLIGFLSAWGYWLTAVFGNVIYTVLLFGTLGFFFPILGKGNNLISLILSSILIWILNFIVCFGVKEASIFSFITTILKVIPIVIFIFVCFYFFDLNIFMSEFWNIEYINKSGDLVSKTIFQQVRGVMILTAWAFIGIEGANIVSQRAKREDIKRSTIIGFFIVLILIVLVNIASYGVMLRSELSSLNSPSMIYVLDRIIGKWGALLINFGIVISLIGASFSWIVFASEIIYQCSLNQSFPLIFKYKNRRNVPTSSLFLSTLSVQFFILLNYYFESGYSNLYYIATSMVLIPYFLSSLYGLKYSFMHKRKIIFIIFYIIANTYSVWLIFAAGLKYLLFSSILYMASIPFYIKASFDFNNRFLKGYEKFVLFIFFVLSIYGSYNLYYGYMDFK